jgi:hypothetical protein
VSESHYEITLRATDSRGLTASRTVTMEPRPEPRAEPVPQAKSEPDAPRTVADLTAPEVAIERRGADRRLARGSILGTASDGGVVEHVEIAVRAARKLGRRCRWWVPGLGRLSHRASSCASPPWIAASLPTAGSSVRWKARLARRPSAGRFVVLARAADESGNRSEPARASRVPVGVR